MGRAAVRHDGVLIGGLIWRYRYDQFGWTTRSSQLYESRLLRIGSPLFHFGILVVIVGHIGGLVIPKSWTEAVGISEGMYHFNALLWGTLAGVCTLVGILILIYRRRTTGPVFMATTKNDKAMYVVLVAAIVAGLCDDRAQRGRRARRRHLPRDRLTLVPLAVLLLTQDRLDGGSSAGLPDPHPHRHAAVRHLAIHPPGARLHGPPALPVPPLHRLPEPRRPGRARSRSDRTVAGPRSARATAAETPESRPTRTILVTSTVPRATTLQTGQTKNLLLALLGFRDHVLGLEHHRAARGAVQRRTGPESLADLPPRRHARARRIPGPGTGRAH